MFDDDVWRYLPFGPLPTLIVAVLGFGLLIAATVFSGRGGLRLRWFLLVITINSILALTLNGGTGSLGRQVNWRVGSGIRAELGNINQALGLVNVLGNVVFFVPLGWLVAVFRSRSPSAGSLRRLSVATLTGLMLSVGIEVAQYVVGRAADVDDVILNGTGALLGAVVGTVLSAILRPPRAHPVGTEQATRAMPTGSGSPG